MDNVFVRPRVVDGKPVLVRDPGTKKPLDVAGEWKTKSQFWVRRIRDGDVVDATAAQAASQKAPATAASPPAAPPSK
jgi:Protein of unknown function (DUF2635)